MTRRSVTKAALLAIVATTIGCDQVSKHFATLHQMGGGRQSFLGDSIRLEYAENTCAFLSLGAGFPPWLRTAVFTFGTGIILVACAFAAARHRRFNLPVVGLCLILAGGVSNLADRITKGAVVDFLNVGLGSLRTGIFNVADLAIVAGIALMLLQRRPAATTTHPSGDDSSAGGASDD